MCIQLLRIGPAKGRKDTSTIFTQVKTSKAIRGPSGYSPVPNKEVNKLEHVN